MRSHYNRLDQLIQKIRCEISSHLSRNVEKTRFDLNLHIYEAINSAIEEKVLPSIKDAIGTCNVGSSTNMDLRSDEPQQNPNGEIRRKTQVEFPKLDSAISNHNNHPRETSIDPQKSNNGYDTLKSTNHFVNLVSLIVSGKINEQLRGISFHNNYENQNLNVVMY